jgi:hypothetical protein
MDRGAKKAHGGYKASSGGSGAGFYSVLPRFALVVEKYDLDKIKDADRG